MAKKKTYIEWVFTSLDRETMDRLIAELYAIGFQGFLEEEDNLKAYIDEDQFDETLLSVPASYPPSVVNKIEEENWNADWESSFQPVRLGDWLCIRAVFHDSAPDVKHEIVITPKMSFGTGHHATTMLMAEAMRELSFAGKSVLDFGTGTGILAILAKKLGADHVTAIDNDTWSIENAAENIGYNHADSIQLFLSDQVPENEKFDIIVANINKHILISHADSLSNVINSGGILIVSGFLETDKPEMLNVFNKKIGDCLTERVKDGWVMMIFTRDHAIY